MCIEIAECSSENDVGNNALDIELLEEMTRFEGKWF